MIVVVSGSKREGDIVRLGLLTLGSPAPDSLRSLCSVIALRARRVGRLALEFGGDRQRCAAVIMAVAKEVPYSLWVVPFGRVAIPTGLLLSPPKADLTMHVVSGFAL
jgi:hypothetical protein